MSRRPATAPTVYATLALASQPTTRQTHRPFRSARHDDHRDETQLDPVVDETSAYEAACEKVRQCAYDGGAFGRIVDQREYLSSDLNHLSIERRANAAAVAWAATRRARVLLRSR